MAADRNGAITGYSVNVTNDETGITVQLFTSSTSLIVDLLEPFTVYAITIAAQTAVGAGPYSITLSQITMEDGKTIIICFNIARVVTGIKKNSFSYKLFTECLCINKQKEFLQGSNLLFMTKLTTIETLCAKSY